MECTGNAFKAFMASKLSVYQLIAQQMTLFLPCSTWMTALFDVGDLFWLLPTNVVKTGQMIPMFLDKRV